MKKLALIMALCFALFFIAGCGQEVGTIEKVEVAQGTDDAKEVKLKKVFSKPIKNETGLEFSSITCEKESFVLPYPESYNVRINHDNDIEFRSPEKDGADIYIRMLSDYGENMTIQKTGAALPAFFDGRASHIKYKIKGVNYTEPERSSTSRMADFEFTGKKKSSAVYETISTPAALKSETSVPLEEDYSSIKYYVYDKQPLLLAAMCPTSKMEYVDNILKYMVSHMKYPAERDIKFNTISLDGAKYEVPSDLSIELESMAEGTDGGIIVTAPTTEGNGFAGVSFAIYAVKEKKTLSDIEEMADSIIADGCVDQMSKFVDVDCAAQKTYCFGKPCFKIHKSLLKNLGTSKTYFTSGTTLESVIFQRPANKGYELIVVTGPFDQVGKDYIIERILE